MARLVYAEVRGLAGLKANLARLEQAILQKAMEEVARAGAGIIQKDAQSMVPRETGQLANDIQIQPQKTALQHEGLVYVGPTQKTAWRAKFIERGTKAHDIVVKSKRALANGVTRVVFGRRVKHRGSRAIPFMRPAMERNRERVFSTMKTLILELIHKALK